MKVVFHKYMKNKIGQLKILACSGGYWHVLWKHLMLLLTCFCQGALQTLDERKIS